MPSTKLKKFLDHNLWPMLVVGSLTALVAFSFAVLKVAERNRAELVTEDYYDRGSNLRDIVDLERATVASGWTVEIVPLNAEATGTPMLQLNVRDRAGESVDSIRGDCALYRPSDKALDIPQHDLVFIGAGRYLRPLPRSLERGQWEAIVSLSRGESRYFNHIPFFIE